MAACLFALGSAVVAHYSHMNLVVGAWFVVGLVVPGSCESHYNKPQLPIMQAGVKLHAQTCLISYSALFTPYQVIH